MMVLSDGRKSFQIGLAILIQYRRVTDTQPRCHRKDTAYYVARVKIQTTFLVWCLPCDSARKYSIDDACWNRCNHSKCTSHRHLL